MELKIYITGALRGVSSEQYEEMKIAANKIKTEGTHVVCAAELQEGYDTPIFENMSYMKPRIIAVMDCNVIVTLDGFDKDPDSALEVHIARNLNTTVTPFHKYYHENIRQ